MTLSPNQLTAIILVGGLGTRLRSVVSNLPKPMAPIKGRPFLEYQLAFLKQSGVTKVIFAVCYLAEIIEEHFGKDWNGIEIDYSRDETLLGTGGAIIKAAKMMPAGSTALIMNGDTYFPISLSKMLDRHISTKASISIAMFESDEARRYSPFSVSKDMKIATTSDENSRLKSGGIYIISGDVMADLRKRPVVKTSFEDNLTPEYLAENCSMFAYVEPCAFIDIGVPTDFARAGQIVVLPDVG